jgi:glycosyltransferase involved in cell wall biosynthesis
MAPAKIKVLHLLVSLPVGGAEDLVAAIVRGLDPARFDVQAATIGPPGAIGEELTRDGFPVHSLGLDLKEDPDLKIVFGLRSLLKNLRPDILHTHLYHPNYYGRLAALGLGLKGLVASVHNIYTRPKFHRRMWNFCLSWVTDRVVAVSPQVWQDVRRYDAVAGSRLLLLPNGISLAALEVPEGREEAKARLGMAGLCLGAVGRLEEQKGHSYLLEALPAVIEALGDITVLLAGDGRLLGPLTLQARELGLTDKVKFLGTRRDMPTIYRALDVFVLPSLWEGLPLALLEAMGAGLPVVATRVGGVVDVIADGVNGRLISPGDSPALARAIVNLARQPKLRAKMGQAARDTVKEHYSQEAMLRKLEALYLELNEGGKGEKPTTKQIYPVSLFASSPFRPAIMTDASAPRRRYTILHTESSLGWGGQERRIVAEGQAMQAKGHRLLIACDPKAALFRRGQAAGFSVFALPFGGLGNVAAWRTLRRLLVREGVDILNTHSSLDSWVGALAWRTMGNRPTLVRTRHLSTPVKQSWPTRWLYNAPAATITTGENIKTLLHERLKVPEERLFAIPTGVPLEEFAPRSPDPGLQASLKLPLHTFVFGTVSVLRSWKGHLFALEALKQLLDAGKPCYLLIVGDGPYLPVIAERIAALGLGDHVRLAGYQERVADWLALMDALVMASYAHEGVPQAVLQALAMAKPVVATTVGGIPEVITPEATGLLAPPKDPEALAQAMARVMVDGPLRERLGRQGKNLVREKYSLERMAEQVEAVYDWAKGMGT